jgi:sulfate permease, SulP family
VPANSYLSLAGSAVGIVLVGFAEGLGAAKTYAARERYDIDPNRELIGLGAANLAAGLSSGMVVNGSLSKTAVNGGAGAKTQASGLLVAVLTVLTLLFLTGLFEDLPETTLAAVVIGAVIELIDVGAMVRLYRCVTGPLKQIYGPAARADFLAAIAAGLGVMIFDTLPGLFIGIGVSVVLLAYRASRPHVAELGLDPTHPDRYVDRSRDPRALPLEGIVILRIESPLFFANADNVDTVVRATGTRQGVRAVVLDAETIAAVDVTAADMLERLVERLGASNVQLVIARGIGQVRDVLSVAEPGRSALPLFPTVHEAVAASTAATPPTET